MEKASKAMKILKSDFISIEQYKEAVYEVNEFLKYIENRVLRADKDEPDPLYLYKDRKLFP